MPTVDRHEESVVAELLASRAAVTELALIAIGLALGINMTSSAITEWISPTVTFAVGLVLAVASLGLAVRRYLRPNTRAVAIDGFLVADRNSGELLAVPTYSFSERAVDYLRSAMVEDSALDHAWHEDPPRFDLEDDLDEEVLPTAGDVILEELVEYSLLAELSSSLTDYFQSMGASSESLSEYGRDDLPSTLIDNRFLELFSRDYELREGFQFLDEYPGNPMIVSATSGSGAYYDRFTLILPKNSTVERRPGHISISGKAIALNLKYSITPSSGGQPLDLVETYTGMPYLDTADFGVDIIADIAVKRSVFFRRRSVSYDAWVEYFIMSLRKHMSTSAFLDRINWPALEASRRVFAPKREMVRPRTSDPSL